MTTLSSLKISLKERGLSCSGSRETLISRLSKYDQAGWKKLDTCYYLENNPNLDSKTIAGFDLDHTLIHPKSGGTFPKDSDDWEFYPNVVEDLKGLHEKGYRIVIFTNQGKQTQREKTLQLLSNVVKAFPYPVSLYAATAKSSTPDKYRKPNTGMWSLATSQMKHLDKSYCFYCGDAAGRPSDHSDSDLQFAMNLGIKFYLPEQILTGYQSQLSKPETEVKEFKYPSIKPSQNQEVVLMVGPPASGKSTLCHNVFIPSKYVQISNDLENGNKTRSIRLADTALKEGLSIVVDNINSTKLNRLSYIKLAKERKLPVRVIWLQTAINVCKERNKLRAKPKPEVVYANYLSKFDEPSLEEGINEIIKI